MLSLLASILAVLLYYKERRRCVDLRRQLDRERKLYEEIVWTQYREASRLRAREAIRPVEREMVQKN